MRLIANKPCSFGGRQFYIGDEIPANLVADARIQEKMGVITIANDTERVPAEESGTFFTQEQVEQMIAGAVEEAERKQADHLADLQEYVAELEETEPGAYDGAVPIAVKDATDEQFTAIPARPEEIQQVFSILQLNAEDGVKAIAEVRSENVLILLHAADNRKTVKNAAKEQADKLFSTKRVPNESTGGNGSIDTHTEGADT